MKLRSDLRLRKIGSQYMIVEPAGGGNRQAKVFESNETAALIWERIGSEEINAEELAAYLSSEYEIDQAVALRDVRHQLEEWEKFGLTV